MFGGPAPNAAKAGSIWDRRTSRHGFLYQDQLASDVGDLMTVIVSDSSSFSQVGERDLQKGSGHGADVSASSGGTPLFKAFGLSESTSREFNGSSEYTGTRAFNDEMSVMVVDKFPNGNMVIAGKKKRKVAGEEVVTIITGIVRPEDLSARNSIPLRNVAKARVFYETKGPSKGFLDLGWFNRVINVLWPL
jgi:flagellar L-ring protein precursor FlgH